MRPPWLFLLACVIMLLNGCLPIQERKCIQGSIIIPTQYGMMKAGEVEVCGQDLEVSGLYGPSFEEYIDRLKEDLEELERGKK